MLCSVACPYQKVSVLPPLSISAEPLKYLTATSKYWFLLVTVGVADAAQANATSVVLAPAVSEDTVKVPPADVTA